MTLKNTAPDTSHPHQLRQPGTEPRRPGQFAAAGLQRHDAHPGRQPAHRAGGPDLIAQAQTGSGKTAAFALALLAKLNPRWFAVQALVLCPTRELADQVTVEIRRLARAEENIKVVTLCGGIALRGQRASLENGAHIVVGTPGRIMDHLERGYLTLEGLNTLVLDEADRMLDMGFFDDIAKVAKQCPARAPNPAVLGHLPRRH
jgi:superfamily II DNA/RNA helicase